VYRDSDGWRARPEIAAVTVPASIQSVILSRVDRLREDARQVLQSASVIGRVFRRRVLARVAQREADLDSTLWELEERALIYEGRITPEPEYAFQHQLTQQTVYNNLLKRQRELFHREVASAIEALYADGLDEFYAQLAYHFEHGGATDQALAYLTMAADKAVGQNALHQAVAFYDRAIEFATGDRLRALHQRRGAAHLELFQGARAAADYQVVLEQARGAGDRTGELEGMLGLARALYIESLDDRGDAVVRSRMLYEQAYDLARLLGNKQAMIRALLGTRWMSDLLPNYVERAAENAREALALSTDIGDDELRIESQMALVRHSSKSEGAELEELLLGGLEGRDLPKLNLVLFSFLTRRLHWGDLAEGIALADRATAVASRIGVLPVQYATFKAVCLLGLGRYGEAWASAEREVADGAHPFARTVRQLGFALYFAELFDHTQVLELATDIAERGRQLRRLWVEDWAEAIRGLALARLGRGAEVDWARFDVEQSRLLAPHMQVAGARAALATGALEEATSRARSAIECSRVRDAAHEMVAAQLVAAQALVRRGRWEETLAYADAGLAVADAKNYLPLQWLLRAARGQALGALNRLDEAQRDRAAATGLLAELAASVYDSDHRRRFLATAEVVTSIEG
jgi:hypothetical protein